MRDGGGDAGNVADGHCPLVKPGEPAGDEGCAGGLGQRYQRDRQAAQGEGPGELQPVLGWTTQVAHCPGEQRTAGRALERGDGFRSVRRGNDGGHQQQGDPGRDGQRELMRKCRPPSLVECVEECQRNDQQQQASDGVQQQHIGGGRLGDVAEANAQCQQKQGAPGEALDACLASETTANGRPA